MGACKHPTCGDVCRRPKKEKRVYVLKRTPLKRKPVKINATGQKRKQELKLYVKQKAAFLANRPSCEIRGPGCTHKATVIHHKKGREGSLFLDATHWAASCPTCNNYVETADEWARQNGHKLSKHAGYQRQPKI